MQTRRLKVSWFVLAACLLSLTVAAFWGTASVGAETAAPSANVLVNGNFENGKQGWTAKIASFTTGAPAQAGSAAAQLKTTKKSGRAQFFQSNIPLQAGAKYVLTFWAKAPSGKDLDISLYKQSSASKSYGLKNKKVNLTSSWKQFTISFTASGFNGSVNDGRLRFRMPKGQGIEFSIDNVSLSIDGSTPPSPPPPGGDKDEMLIFDWNKQVTKSHSGFAMQQPPNENGNWVSPINFAGGTIHFRAQVRSIPKNQPDMKLGWCVWQDGFTRENCKGNNVAGTPGNVVTWSIKIKDMWKKNGVPINWAQPRTREGFIVRNKKGPVSSKAGMNWSGENPDDWYPLDIRVTAVVVAAGGTFSGWDHYIK